MIECFLSKHKALSSKPQYSQEQNKSRIAKSWYIRVSLSNVASLGSFLRRGSRAFEVNTKLQSYDFKYRLLMEKRPRKNI